MLRTGLVLLLVLGSGCYYGTMEGAHTLGEGHMVFSGNLVLPAYLNAEERAEAEDTREDYLGVYPTFRFATGATENIDIGMSAYGYGIGPHLKMSLYPSREVNAISAILDVNYVLPTQVISPRGCIAVGRRFGRSLQFYGGYELGYGPDLANIPEDEEGNDDWDQIENTLFHGAKIGCIYELKPRGGETSYGALVPEGICFEFTAPFDLSRSMIVAGLGVIY
ncbi:hypothetical protein GF402_10485 [Candidatus Fermentibacteria bacterium]|nr:hypothetical protein [Candidatus Fermentibacteria bacterium]